MPDAAPVYRKMPGTGGGLFHRSTLWLGPDHLLLVQSTPVSETYRRFYFRSIQNVTVRKTNLRTKRLLGMLNELEP